MSSSAMKNLPANRNWLCINQPYEVIKSICYAVVTEGVKIKGEDCSIWGVLNMPQGGCHMGSIAEFLSWSSRIWGEQWILEQMSCPSPTIERQIERGQATRADEPRVPAWGG